METEYPHPHLLTPATTDPGHFFSSALALTLRAYSATLTTFPRFAGALRIHRSKSARATRTSLPRRTAGSRPALISRLIVFALHPATVAASVIERYPDAGSRCGTSVPMTSRIASTMRARSLASSIIYRAHALSGGSLVWHDD